MPRVSVIIPTHSRPHLLTRAVQSAKAAAKDVEIIVVDDASTDETASTCRRLQGIKYIRLERNQGVAGARNVGLLHSEGKYIAFLDDDDLRLPGSLDDQADALDADPEAGIVCGSMIMADQDYQATGEVIGPRQSGGDVFWDLLEFDFPIMGLSALIRKECFLRAGLLKRRLSGIDDWDIFVRIAELYSVLISTGPVGIYRQPTPNSGQGSSARAAQLHSVARHLRRLLELPRARAAPSSKRRSIRRRTINRIADTLLWNSARLLPYGELRQVCANISVALQLNPLRAVRPGSYRKLVQTFWQKRNPKGN
jgi:glycosyltransferase involved in cell wall biosynthesis